MKPFKSIHTNSPLVSTIKATCDSPFSIVWTAAKANLEASFVIPVQSPVTLITKLLNLAIAGTFVVNVEMKHVFQRNARFHPKDPSKEQIQIIIRLFSLKQCTISLPNSAIATANLMS